MSQFEILINNIYQTFTLIHSIISFTNYKLHKNILILIERKNHFIETDMNN